MSGSPPEEERFATNVSDLSDLIHELVCICYDEGYKDVNPFLIKGAQMYLNTFDKN